MKDINYMLNSKKTQNELVKELFKFLDYAEETDSGNIFHPIHIACCRSMMMKSVGDCVAALRESINNEAQQ